MNKISVLDTDQWNLVKFYEQFQFMGKTFLVFEMLDRTLEDLLRAANWVPLNTNVIRPIAQQVCFVPTNICSSIYLDQFLTAVVGNSTFGLMWLLLQLLVALDALQGLGVLHTDIKPDNIMLVDMQDQPYRIKLIDFGLAISASQIYPGETLQPVGYRWVQPARFRSKPSCGLSELQSKFLMFSSSSSTELQKCPSASPSLRL